MALNITTLRSFAGIDTDVASDEVVQTYLDMAAAWYAKGGVPTTTTGALYEGYIYNLAGWLYDHKSSGEDVPSVFVASVHMLRPLTSEE